MRGDAERFEHGLTLSPLTADMLEDAVRLCGECVGEGLYTADELAKALALPTHRYTAYVTVDGRPVAYAYYRLTDLRGAAALAKLEPERLSRVFPGERPVIGVLQSVGVAQSYRRHGLSEKLVERFLEWLERGTDAVAAFAVAWRPGGEAPMELTLRRAGFAYLCDAHGVWSDCEGLVCPVCAGRCVCGAAVYYKPMERSAVK